MDLRRFHDAEQFGRIAEPWLVRREAEHNLLLGICSALVRQPGRYQSPYLALVQEGDQIVAVAIRTPPQNLVLSQIDRPEALDLLANELAARSEELPGVLGTTAVSQAFARRWQALTGRTYYRHMAQRIFQLEKVIPVEAVPGSIRPATGEHRERIVEWMLAFSAEALQPIERSAAEQIAERFLQLTPPRLYFWENNGPVSMAATVGVTPNGARIGAVYTPPEHRRNGYASACVAALSQLLLDSGRKFCFLFTDLANPTSNRIYRTIGYQPVSDVDEYHFTMPD